ncbi:MAG: hypothetical protein ACPL1A_08465 [Candidatus Kapaibacteriota bacterium]
MKILGFLFLSFYQILSLQLFAQDDNDIVKINIDNPNEYLPEYLNNIYLGISFKDFTNIKDNLFFRK